MALSFEPASLLKPSRSFGHQSTFQGRSTSLWGQEARLAASVPVRNLPRAVRHSPRAASSGLSGRIEATEGASLPRVINPLAEALDAIPIRQSSFGGPDCSGRRRGRRVVTRGKFQTFDKAAAEAAAQNDVSSDGDVPEETEQGRPDDVLPADLPSAIRQAGIAAATFCNAGGTRALVELLVPEMEVVAEDGAQQRVWDASRLFLEALKGEVSCENVRAIFPDAGAAALMKHKWGQDIPFAISSLNDRRPVADEDELVVLVSPDWQLLEKVQQIAGILAAEDGLTRPMIMWNPRLSSGEVGIGLNVRRMRDFFLGSFTPVYFMRPLGIGAIFRAYPSAWNLFLDDPDEPGRYLLYRQQGSKPSGDDIEEMYFAAAGKSGEEGGEPNFLDQLASTVSSLSRFMNSLSK